MLRTFRYPLHPTVEQEVVLDGWLVRACSLYNAALEGMTHGTLGKSIHDAGWRVFIQALTSKAEEAGLLAVAVDPRGTTRSCSRCGATGPPKGLGDREHVCDACGCRMGRDHNAALNIRARGLRAVSGQPRAEASEVSHV